MFRKEPKTTAYLYDTPIENIFIAEYMPEIPGDYLKVYLYAQMLASRGEAVPEEVLAQAAGYREIARALDMESVDVEKAFVYLEEMGLVEKQAGRWTFPMMKEKLFGSGKVQRGAASAARPDKGGQKEGAGAGRPSYRHILENKPIAEMTAKIQNIVERFLLPEENQAIIDWITTLQIDPDLIVRAYEYAKQRGATSHRYVNKVLLGWMDNGIRTREAADEYLSERDERHFVYRRVMQALGFTRNVTEEEARLIDEWVDVMDCRMPQILEACGKTAGIGNPNIKYIDAVLRRKMGMADTAGAARGDREPTRSQILSYYAHLREEAEARAEAARQDVYRKAPQVRQMDEQIRAASREMTNVMVGGGADKAERIRGLRAAIAKTENERTRLLTEMGIPIDFMNVRYRCARCGDTGVLDNGARCSCYLEVVKEAAGWHEEEK